MKQHTFLNETQPLTADSQQSLGSQEPSKVLVFPPRTKQPEITTDYINQLCQQATCENTHRAHTQDKRYFWHWAKAFDNHHEHYPVSIELIQQFLVAHTLKIDPELDARLVGLGLKKRPGAYKMATLNRILSTLSREHELRNLENPVSQPQVKLLKRQLKKIHQDASLKRKQAITLPVLVKLLETCDRTSVMGLRDAALLTIGFASGGRRRSELSNFLYEDLTEVEEGFLLRLRKSKNDQTAEGKSLPIFGKATVALRRWLKISGINSGFLFRSVSQSGKIGKSLSARAVDQIVKKRIKLAGLNPADYSAHSLRSGFMTESATQGVSLPEAMQLSTHATQAVAIQYYREGTLTNNPAARLID